MTRPYWFDRSRSKLVRASVRGDVVYGKARKPLCVGLKGPIMAVTWPFHELELLNRFKSTLSELGYDSYIHKRGDHDLYELIVGMPADTETEQ